MAVMMYSLLSMGRGLIGNFLSPKSISMWWNFGSMSGLWMVMQVVSGLLMASALIAGSGYAFDSVEYIMESLMGSSIMRFVHANFCSGVFIVMILHLGKSLWYSSSSKSNLWKSSVMLLILTMSASFLGYVLPWGHMSFWGATVITSLASVLPYSVDIVIMIWSGFSLSTACLGRFFMLHFLLPLLIIAVIVVHLVLLHEYVSSSIVNISGSYNFTMWLLKDAVTVMGSIGVMMSILVMSPIMFMDADNWFHANPMTTPEHIKPEWYFLFAYCILRCIPDKVFSVLSLVGSLLMIGYIGVLNSGYVAPGVFVILTWLSSAEVNDHMTLASQFVSVVYFLCV